MLCDSKSNDELKEHISESEGGGSCGSEEDEGF